MPPTIVYFSGFSIYFSIPRNFVAYDFNHFVLGIKFYILLVRCLLTAVGYGIAAFLLKTKYADVSRGYFYYLGLHLQGFVASSGNSGNLSAIH